MGKNSVLFVVATLSLLLLGCSSSSSAAPPAAKIVGTVVTNVVSLFKLLWSLRSTTPTPKPAVPSRSTMKFESGYTVETVFDGSKVGIEPFSMEVSPAGEVFILDYQNSNIYKTSSPLSRNSRPKLVVGSPEGYTGHVDGKLREAKMNHPKGFAIDDAGNVYVADTMNFAIRKISDSGVVTIAGRGKWARGGAHMDGPSEDAKFSNDFDLVYVGSSCSLLVIDRGNQAIREIQLHQDDCSDRHYRHHHHHREDNDDDEAHLHHLGTALLATAVFLGYMIALVQRRMAALFSSHRDLETPTRGILPPPPSQYQLNAKPIRPPLIPAPLLPQDDDEYEKTDENLFVSIGRLFASASASLFEIFGGLFWRSRPNKKSRPQQHYHPRLQHYTSYPNPDNPSIAPPLQESYIIPREEVPPHLESVDPTPRNSYSHTPPKDVERARHYKQNRSNTTYGEWTSDPRQQLPQQQQQQQFQQQHYQPQQQQQQFQQLHRHQKNRTPSPQTYIEKSCETKEIVFGAVQEQDRRREAMVIKAVDYSDPVALNRYNVRSRYNYNATYSHGYN